MIKEKSDMYPILSNHLLSLLYICTLECPKMHIFFKIIFGSGLFKSILTLLPYIYVMFVDFFFFTIWDTLTCISLSIYESINVSYSRKSLETNQRYNTPTHYTFLFLPSKS